jgi:hypothetical protein
MQNASYWHHLVSWYERRSDPDVLLVFFEDLKDDLPAHVHRIANFMGFTPVRGTLTLLGGAEDEHTQHPLHHQ